MSEETSFEADLRQLEKAVKALESGELGLDAALAQYEGGIRLLANCHARLEAAGKKVALLTGATEQAEPETAPFDAAATVEVVSRSTRAAAPKDDADDDLPF